MKKIRYSSEAYEALRRIGDRKVCSSILESIEHVAKSKIHGKSLVSPLEGYKSVRAVRDKYRIIYKDGEELAVLTVGKRLPGSAEDIYELAGKLVSLIRGR